MGNQPCAEFNVGTTVSARYNSNSKSYHAAKIIKKHSGDHLGQYDVKFFPNGPIHTVFGNDIRYDVNNCDIQTNWSFIDRSSYPHNITQKEQVIQPIPKIFHLQLTDDTHTQTTQICHELDLCMKQKKNLRINLTNNDKHKSLSPHKFKQIETVIRKVGGNALYQDIISSERENVNRNIIESIKYAATSKQNKDIKYISYLTSVESVPIINGSTMVYTIIMDLDYDEIVMKNDNFTNEINEEIASILHIDASLIQIKSIEDNCVKVTIAIMAAIAVVCMIMFHRAYKYITERKKKVFKNMECDVFPDEYNPGDQVVVQYKKQKYAAVVLQKRMDYEGLWIKVEYLGHPFLFKNTEEIRSDSMRLEFIEPGAQYESFLIASDEKSVYIEASRSN